MRFVYTTIVIIYLFLPSITEGIFDAIECKSYLSNDLTQDQKSYLINNWDVQCSKEDNEYKSTMPTFIALLILFPIGLPCGFLILLLSIRKSVQSKQITNLAQASRFLWRDYNTEVMFWDLFDIIRKVVLTGTHDMLYIWHIYSVWFYYVCQY